jgi:hypothetical protein
MGTFATITNTIASIATILLIDTLYDMETLLDQGIDIETDYATIDFEMDGDEIMDVTEVAYGDVIITLTNEMKNEIIDARYDEMIEAAYDVRY